MKAGNPFFAMAAAALLLAGCAHPQLFGVGAPEAEIVASLGNPDARVPQEDGTTRLVYSMQPAGQECWWMVLDASGRLASMRQVYFEENFEWVKPGMRIEEVFRLFGHPAEIYDFKMLRQSAYMYRFEHVTGRPAVFWVQYGRDGVVTETEVSLIDPTMPDDGDAFE